MSCIIVKIVDLQKENEPVDIEQLTKLGIDECIYQCNLLKRDLLEAKNKIQEG